MKKYKNKNRAFTLIETMVVIATISILTAIVVVGYSAIQKDTRDSARSSRVTVIAESLERYYDINNEYPSVASLAGQPISAIKTKLSIKDDSALVFPNGATNLSAFTTTTPSTTALLYTAATRDITPAVQAQCQNDVNGYCDSFQMQYVAEKDGATVTVGSRKNGDVVITGGCTGSCLVAPTKPSVVGAQSGSNIVFTASASSCSIGTVQYKIRHSTVSAASLPAWSTVSWSSATTKTIAAGTDKTFYSSAIAQCVSGTNTGPTSIESDVHTLTLPSPPSAPVVSTSSITTSSVQVSWTASTGTAPITYSVTGGGNASSCTVSPCNVTGLASGTTYTFTVTATNAAGSASGSASATTSTPPSPPSAPSVSATTLSSSSIRVSWGVSSGTPTISYSVSGGGTASSCTVSPCDVTSLAAGTTYTFTVTATNAAGSASGSASATTYTPPSAPSVTATTLSGSSIRVSWGVSSGTAPITYSVSGGGTASSCTVSPCDVTSLAAGTIYTFTVTATNSAGSASGSASNSTTFTTLGAPTVSAVGALNRTTYSWSGVACPAGATKEYQYALIGNWTGGTGAYNGPTTATSYAWIDSAQGYTFTGRVMQRCSNSYTTGAWSVYGSDSYARPVEAPGQPTAFTKNPGPNYISFNWTPPTCGPSTTHQHQIDFVNGGGTGILWITAPSGRTDGWWYGFANTAIDGARPDGAWRTGSYIGPMGDRNSANSINPPRMNLDTGVNAQFDVGNIIGVAVQHRCINSDTNVASGLGPKNGMTHYY